jgi:hypothetical protein
MEVHPTRVNNKFARRKKKDPTKWKANIAKRSRYVLTLFQRRAVTTHSFFNLQC